MCLVSILKNSQGHPDRVFLKKEVFMKQIKRKLSIIIPRSIQNFIKKRFIKKGQNTFICKPFRIDQPKQIKIGREGYVGDDSTLSCYGGKLTIGDNFYATRNLNVYCGEEIEIDADVLIGSYVLITDLSHGINPEDEKNYQKQAITTKPVFIGKGCWLGDKVSVLPGTHIGEKCVVGSNSVVRGEIPPFSMVAGNPGKVVKRWCAIKKEWIKV